MLKKLDWDTRVFGYPVYLYKCEGLENELEYLVSELLKTNFQVCYLDAFSFEESTLDLLKVYFEETIFISNKIVFESSLINSSIECNLLSEKQKVYFKESIIDLCLQSGHYSRFFRDSRFKNNEFKILYEAWAISAIISNSKNILTLLDSTKTKLLGMAIVSETLTTLIIEIIAVDIKYRNLGLGSQLIEKIRSYAANKKLERIEVATQFENQSAYNYYIKNGFTIKSSTFQYHVWNN